MQERKRVQITNLAEYFSMVEFNTFYCLNDLEQQVQKSNELIDFVMCTINDNRDAIFILKGVKIDERNVKVFHYQFKETVS